MSKVLENKIPETIIKNENMKYNKSFILNSKEKDKSEYCILSLLIDKTDKDNSRRCSLRTNDTYLIENDFKFDYEIKKFDELNNSLSEISDFDLEKNEDCNESDFNSSEDENENEIEDEKIIFKNKPKKEYDDEYEIQIEKEYEEILKEIKFKKIIKRFNELFKLK